MNKLKLYDAPKQSTIFLASSEIVERDGKKVIQTGGVMSADVVWQDGEWVIAKRAGKMAGGAARGGKGKYAPTEYLLVNSSNWLEHGRVEPGRGRACQTAIKGFQQAVAAIKGTVAS
jgi:hypothetical protein